jgi:hypothetical protein
MPLKANARKGSDSVIIAGLIISGAALAAFLILVAGIRCTDRNRGLRDPSGDGRTEAFARRVLGVYVRQPSSRDHPQDRANRYGQARR